MLKSKEQAVLELTKKMGAIRIKDLYEHGIHPEFARRLVGKEMLIRSSRGIYSLAGSEITEHHSFAIIGKRTPKGVICLTSALHFHSIGTQLPRRIWLALEKGSAQPCFDYPPLSVVRFSGPSFTEGIEEHRIEGIKIRIYNPAKSVADCFKFRNRIGLDVALEAAREALNGRRASSDQIYHYAKICRVWNVMRPYLEAIQNGQICLLKDNALSFNKNSA